MAESRAQIPKTQHCPEDPCGHRQLCRLKASPQLPNVFVGKVYDDRPSDGAGTQTIGLFGEANPAIAVDSLSQLRDFTDRRLVRERRAWQKEIAPTATTEDGWILVSDDGQKHLSGLSRSLVVANELPPGDVVHAEHELLVTAQDEAPSATLRGNLLTGEWTPPQLMSIGAGALLGTALLGKVF